MNTMTATEYLTDTKFRNAVKRTLAHFRVLGKNEAGRRYSVRIQTATYNDDTLFTITYRGGDAGFNGDKIVIAKLEKQLQMERQLVMAGFEMTPATDDWGNATVAWRKAAN